MVSEMDLRIRNFDENDTESVIEIHKLCSSEFQFEEITPEFMREISQRQDFKFIVAVLDDKVAGFAGALFYESFGVSELGPVAVHPGLRNRGIGTGLVKYLLEFLESKKIKTIIVCVKSGNKNAANFFENFGFEFEEEFKDYIQGGESIIRMIKVL